MTLGGGASLMVVALTSRGMASRQSPNEYRLALQACVPQPLAPGRHITVEVERNEQNQSIQAILESITSGEAGVSHSDPIAGFHHVNPGNPGHQGHLETAK